MREPVHFSPLVIALIMAACSAPAPDTPHDGGGGSSTGQSGSSGSGGSAGSSTGQSGSSGSGGSAGTGGMAGSGGASGAAGAAAGAGGSSGGSGAAGSASDGGAVIDGGNDATSTPDTGPTGPTKQWSCPAGPFPAQMMGTSTPICAGFAYNYGYNEGPTWIASQNAFFFSNFVQGGAMGGDVIKYTIGGQCEIFLRNAGCNGLAVGPTGKLIGACHQPRAVMEYDLVSKQPRVLADMAEGKMLDSPNDLVAHSNGNIYFSNTTYELGGRPVGLGTALVRIDPLGMTSVVMKGGLNGIALSPDEKKLYVVGMGIWDVDDQGVPTVRTGAGPGGDGISVDCAGNVHQQGTNSAFGGPDGKTMLIVGGGTNARTVQMTVPGLP
ncbi:MAG TPA: SMP-30/gluconolactonase/LRE family protein [Polyangiaceae bacterium]|nr:SMP-30/gluconolactonase/LRE family protein [Polyangiaceae bacterium]